MANLTNNHGNVAARVGKKAAAAYKRGQVINNKGVIGTASTVNIGVLAHDVATDDELETFFYQERAIGLSGAAVTDDTELTSDAAGKLVDAVATKWVVAISCASTTGADEEFEIWTVSPYIKA